MKRFLLIFAAALLGLAGTARADVLVLVHGYLGSAASWDWGGVAQTLEVNGWGRAGLAGPVPGGLAATGPGAGAANKFYVVDLPSEAPVLVQAEHLRAQLAAIRERHPDEPLTLAGHSAGGVVARAVLVREDAPRVDTLVTIASPHLGTLRAGEALDVADIPFPFSVVPSFFGGNGYDALRRSRVLLSEMLPPYPGSLLAWLNHQPHPDIRYVSIVRGAPYAVWGDSIVPGFSQDMNNVPALAGKSEVVTVPAPHGLEPRDGMALVGVL